MTTILRVTALICVFAGITSAETRHVTNADGKGWLVVKWSSGGTVPAVPQFLRVDFIKREGGRDYFKVLEGARATMEASVVQKAGGGSYLAPGDSKEAAATLKFDRKKKQLWYGGTGPIATITHETKPVPLGVQDLEIPDEVHEKGAPYLQDSPFATTWFRIGHSGDRYLHPGLVSDGCVTVTDTKKWTEVYNYLIKRRKGDDKSVGTIEIVE
jgi:hypothetical protein